MRVRVGPIADRDSQNTVCGGIGYQERALNSHNFIFRTGSSLHKTRFPHIILQIVLKK